MLRTNHLEQYALIETSQHKCPENANDPKNEKHELLILKYNANQDALIVGKEGNPMEEERETKIPSTLESKDGDLKNTNEESYGSCN